MLMPLNLVLSYLLSLLGVKFVYRDSLSQRDLLSIGLFIGSLVALINLIAYFILSNNSPIIPVIITAIFLGYEYYVLNYSKKKETDVNAEELTEIHDEKMVSPDSYNIIINEDFQNAEPKKENNNKKLVSIDDLIKE